MKQLVNYILNARYGVLALVAAFCFATAQMASATTQSDDLFTSIGTEVTGLTANQKILLGLALAPLLLFLGWKYLKRAKGAA